VIFAPALTSFSTFILLMSSLMMALAVNAIQKGNVKSCRWSLLTTAFFGAIFLTCQVYEFTEFALVKKMTISNSLLGTTFFTLTGTHGCHVAIGVLWLCLMYVRSFKPAASSTGSWFGRQLIHAVVLLGTILLSMKVVLAFTFALVEHGFNGATITHVLKTDLLYMVLTFVGYGVLRWFARPAGAVDFNEHHAVDVETMGLYWHFVDIVWIVIFTAVYLLEYL
jgi:cytochrome o ubiquinol oxidase subunit 3